MASTLVPYCERLLTGAETWNVVSNVAFIALGCYALSRMQAQTRANGPDARLPAYLFAWLPFVVALGSSLYHARPNHFTQILDILPIGLFVAFSLWLALRTLLALSVGATLVCLLPWLAATLVFGSFPGVLGGSLLYAPTLLTILLVAAATRSIGIDLPDRTVRLRAAASLLHAALAFALALVARTVDLSSCGHLGVGTHPLWHVLAAAAGAFVVQALNHARKTNTQSGT